MGESAPVGELASAGALLPGGRIQAGAAQRRQHETLVAPDAELPVLGFHALVERTRTATLVQRLRIKLGFPREVFERAVSPVIEGYAEFVQLLPAPESRFHAHPGGLFTRGLEVASRALDYRRGQILPRGAAPEVIGAQAHRWTYAVFIGAVLHDIGRTMAALRVLVRSAHGAPEPWAPHLGSMSACAAVSYRVAFLEHGLGQDALHGVLPVQLLNRFVPPSVLDWLAADTGLMRELLGFLSQDTSGQVGAISELVLRAAAEVASRDLLPYGGGDPPARQGASIANPGSARVEGPFDGPTAKPGTTVAAQPDAAATATNAPALPDKEIEYLEDRDEARGLRRESWTTDPALAHAPDAARRFMHWVERGLAEGTIRVNKAGALVHFVEEGMLLVSPRIFQEFAKRFGEDGCGHDPASAAGEPDPGRSIQRQFLRAGWHLRADSGVNILTYHVMRRDRAVSRLSGVVIGNPARFVDPVPPANPLLVRSHEARGDA